MAEATRRLGPYWTMTRSQVYRELPALAEAGLVRVGKPGPRASVPYTISANGKRAFTRWLNEPARIGQLRDPVALRTAFTDYMAADTLDDMYGDALEQHQEALTEARASVKDYADEDPGASAAMEFAVGYHRAAVNWIKKRTS
ncbi:helix-turn-helix transcriptional regulator [Glycomyces albus]|nr:PadR family transcriptional regulator [Glycomyces salinus]